MRFRLSPGVDQPGSRPTTNQVTATELSQNETEILLKRLPPMQVDGSDSQEFALRERSMPPPRTGQTIWEGVYNYSYVARATTPGSFVVPPSKAEEMYHPETFGRSNTDHVRID